MVELGDGARFAVEARAELRIGSEASGRILIASPVTELGWRLPGGP